LNQSERRNKARILVCASHAIKMGIHLYEILGRKKEKDGDKMKTSKVYRMKIFASNSVVARSRFWYFLCNLRKIKRANGEIISVREIFEKNPNFVKNFGVWLRYDSRSGTHNMYKEYRDTTLTGAIEKMYSEMASRHRARKRSIQILRTATLKTADVKRENTQQFINGKLKFRLMHRLSRPQSKAYRKTFKSTRPCTFF